MTTCNLIYRFTYKEFFERAITPAFKLLSMKLSNGTTCCIAFFLTVTASAQVQKGEGSFYADKFEGKTTASGEIYSHTKLTAAHRTLPFGTRLRVTNIATNETVEVIVNDRGPFAEGRIIDLSRAAAEKL